MASPHYPEFYSAVSSSNFTQINDFLESERAVATLLVQERVAILGIALHLQSYDLVKTLLQEETFRSALKAEPHLLFTAVRTFRLDLVQEVLAAGANPNQQDDNGDTPLWIALDHHEFDMAATLMDYWADFTIPKKGLRPLDKLRQEGQEDLAQFFEESVKQRVLMLAKVDERRREAKEDNRGRAIYELSGMAHRAKHHDTAALRRALGCFELLDKKVRALLDLLAQHKLDQPEEEKAKAAFIEELDQCYHSDTYEVKSYTHLPLSGDCVLKLFAETKKFHDRLAKLNPTHPLNESLALLIQENLKFKSGTQAWLINAIKKILLENHPELSSIDIDGLCYGFTYMGAQAIECDGLAAFKNRIEVIESHSVELLAMKIEEAKKVIRNLARAYQEAKEEASTVEIQGFLEGVLLLQEPTLSPEATGMRKPASGWDPFQDRQNAFKMAFAVLSARLEELGGITEPAMPTGLNDAAYNQDQLTLSYKQLREAIQTKAPLYHSLSFPLCAEQHSLAIGYNHHNNKWIFIDINPKVRVQETKSNWLLAEKVRSGFQVFKLNTYICINTTAYSSKKPERKKMADELIQTWAELRLSSHDKWVVAMEKAIDEKDLDTLRAVIKKGVDLNYGQRFSFLDRVMREGLVPLFIELIQNGATRTNNWPSPFDFALSTGLLEVLQITLNSKLDLDVQPYSQTNSPLHSAIKSGKLEFVIAFLSAGAKLHLAKDSEYDKPLRYLEYAQKKNFPAIVSFLETAYELEAEIDSLVTGLNNRPQQSQTSSLCFWQESKIIADTDKALDLCLSKVALKKSDGNLRELDEAINACISNPLSRIIQDDKCNMFLEYLQNACRLMLSHRVDGQVLTPQPALSSLKM